MKLTITGIALAALVLIFAAPVAQAAGGAPLDSEVLATDLQGNPTFIQGSLGVLVERNRRVAAVDFLQGMVVDTFGAAGTEELIATGVRRDRLGTFHVRVSQKIAGLPVVGAELIVHARQGSGQVYAVNGRFVADKGLPREADVPAADALSISLAQEDFEVGSVLSDTDLVYVLGSDDQPHLAWRTLVEYNSAEGYAVDWIFSSAKTGSIVARHPTIHPAKSWQTYDGNNGSSLPGTLRCTNGGACSDSIEQAIHDNAGLTWDYYNARFGRDSYTGSGATIRSTAHHLNNYVNAFWNGSQLVYGDGDGVNSGPLGNAFDIVVHEFTHAVTTNESNLIYQNESGALNEGWSDIFSAGAEAWRDGGVNSNTWKLGESTWTPGTAGDALRYMNNPTQDGSSRDYYPERYTGTQDNGGVHWNSGIANLAFYLLTQGGTHPRGKTTVSVPGIGIAKAEQIFYRAQTTYLTSSSNFQSARNATASAASDLYGTAEVNAVQAAWDAVGVPGGGPPPPSGCPAGSTVYAGTISAGATQVTAGASASGSFTATMTGSAPDVDLYLDLESCSWWSCSWSAVASSTSASSTEAISYSGSSGTYRWRIVGYSGTNVSYTLCTQPAL